MRASWPEVSFLVMVSRNLWAIWPVHHPNAPPSVLPTVAMTTTLQNISGSTFNMPNIMGSDPKGTKVAEMNDMTNTADKPYSGKASVDNIVLNHSDMTRV
jgi:hypothetical protein